MEKSRIISDKNSLNDHAKESSIEQQAIKGASWLAFYRLISQLFSWVVTIVVARILSPEDYGLMAMATILTGYAMLFNELGLGAAIIQRPKTNQEELSSVFWFSFMTSSVLAMGAFAAAYPTSWIFGEPRLIPITKTVSVVFIINGLQIVPLSLIKKELNFKRLGFIEMTGILVSCVGMLVMALLGAGVWTLIGGYIIQGVTKLVLLYYHQGWFPRLYYRFQDAKSYIGFGIMVAVGGSFHYVFEQSDKFFAGRAWSSKILGYYAFAWQLACMPTDKIVTLINQVSFSVFSRLQDDRERFNKFYLNINKATATLVLPLFAGGFILGDELIRVVLNEKWWAISTLFRFLCLAQILVSINAVNNFVHTAQGRPEWRLYFNGTCAVLMSVSFFFAVQHGLEAILVPWFTTYLLISLVWITLTLRQIGITVFDYLQNLSVPFCATIAVSAVVLLTGQVLRSIPLELPHESIFLLLKIAVGALCYVSFMLLFAREFLINAIKLLRA